MENKLVEKFVRARSLMLEKKPSIRDLEQLAEDTKKAFDDALESIFRKRNFKNEIAIRRKQLKEWRLGIYHTILPINYKHLLSMPFIYAISIPMVIFDICLEIYHHVCFRLYGIPLVKRKDYFIYDRQKLPYLNWIEKIHCFYCSYANNLMRYGVEIAGRTERYWCPIKHASKISNPHSQYPKFVDYLDGENFRQTWENLRDFSDMKKEKGKQDND